MKYLITLLLIVLLFRTEVQSCTIVMISDSNTAIAGSNEDSVFPLSTLMFIPASEGYYARAVFGYNMMRNSVQGGMNEKGLFVDGNSLGNTGWKYEKNKKPLMTSILDKLLASCASVEEVKEFCMDYNVKELRNARIPVMDKSGASMIIEWHDGQVVFLETDENYQVSTNFIGSEYIGKEKTCWRYNKAIDVCKSNDKYSIELVRDALDSSHLDNDLSKTIYSFICDLKKGDIYIYNYFDFSRSVKFNLFEEVKKGQQHFYIGSLFPERTANYKEFLKQGPVLMIERGYRRNKMGALTFYNILKNNYPKAFDIEINSDVLSEVGENLQAEGKLEDAIYFLEINAKDFPDDTRTHIELGDAYLKNNEIEKAKHEYDIVLQKDPGNKTALEALNKLEN
ncbi:carcinine hydrolase/isopenicillin-N N-acyltransferase family protein [Bacteroidota bacterium]